MKQANSSGPASAKTCACSNGSSTVATAEWAPALVVFALPPSLARELERFAAVRVLTMGLLGVAVMRLSDRLGPMENADDLARDVLDVLIAGLQSGLRLRTHGLLVCPEDEQHLASDTSASDFRSVR